MGRRAVTGSSRTRNVRGLILDFGGVVIKTPFELVRGLERQLGVADGTFDWHGPFAPRRDELWRRMQRAEISEREYWGMRAAEAGRAIGATWTVRDLIAHLEADEHEFVRPEAVRALETAAAARVPVVVLTNDLAAFHGAEWFGQLEIAGLFDDVVDGSVSGILKPDQRSYRAALAAIGLEPHEALFVDDQPRNVAGAEAAGLNALLFDVTQPGAAFERVLRAIAKAA